MLIVGQQEEIIEIGKITISVRRDHIWRPARQQYGQAAGRPPVSPPLRRFDLDKPPALRRFYPDKP